MAWRFVILVGGALACGASMLGPHSTILRASSESPQTPPATTAAPAQAPAASTGNRNEYVVIVPGSKEYHRPGCELVRGAKAPTVLMKFQAEDRGLKAHADCDPANMQPDGTPKPKPVFVYVQKDDNKYHKAGCTLLKKDASRVLLDKDAVRGRWPCTVCRPPLRVTPKPAR